MRKMMKRRRKARRKRRHWRRKKRRSAQICGGRRKENGGRKGKTGENEIFEFELCFEISCPKTEEFWTFHMSPYDTDRSSLRSTVHNHWV